MDAVLKQERTKCLFALISSAVVVICVAVAITMNLTTIYDENFDHMGIRTFCMFTVNSNLAAAVGMGIVFPYTVDGLRKNNYHLPNWVVGVLFVGVTCVSLTFLVSLFILAPAKGFVLIFSGSRFFLHGVCPILSIIAFCCFIVDHRISVKETMLPLIPVLVYSILYVTMVVIIGEERGGWNDFYGFMTRIPKWIPLVTILPVTFCIAMLLRLGHNGSYNRTLKHDAEIYEKVYGGADVRKVVRSMAEAFRTTVRIRDIVVPVRVINVLLRYSGDTGCSLEECCRLFVDICLYEKDSDTEKRDRAATL
ncbi:MAG: hypothetical protein IJK14_01595 [Clostridia bacterium]|nr:hypothetical protein [Clostridia bacterium]MBR0444058.1 hypothetical protein [Clostridia bacterium]